MFSMRHLKPLGNHPHGVSSQSQSAKMRVDPLYYSGTSQEPWEVVKQVASELPRSILVEESVNYLHYEVRTRIFKFVDDLEFALDAGGSRIEIRSASRNWYWDIGVNRKRVEEIREAFNVEMDRRLAGKQVGHQLRPAGGLRHTPEALRKLSSTTPEE